MSASLTGGTTQTARRVKNQFGPSGDYADLDSDDYGNLGALFAESVGGGVTRGGYWNSQQSAGLFATDLGPSARAFSERSGFRCVTSPL